MFSIVIAGRRLGTDDLARFYFASQIDVKNAAANASQNRVW